MTGSGVIAPCLFWLRKVCMSVLWQGDVRKWGYLWKKEIAMKRRKEEKRARLLVRTEKVVDEYLA